MIEKRLFPRLDTNLEARVEMSSGHSQAAIVRNISAGGLMLDSDLVLKEQLSSSDTTPTFGAPPVEITVTLQLPRQQLPLKTRCRLVFIRRLSQQEFNLGFRFVNINADTAERLQRYLDQAINDDSITDNRNSLG